MALIVISSYTGVRFVRGLPYFVPQKQAMVRTSHGAAVRSAVTLSVTQNMYSK